MDNFDLRKFLRENNLPEITLQTPRTGITGIVDTLLNEFCKEFNIDLYKGRPWVTPPSGRVWVRSDGTRYKEPGNIDGNRVDEFWEWLQNKPGVKQIGKVGGSFRSDAKMDSVSYKGIYLSKRFENFIIFGSINRVKKGRAWDPE
jgi:hypothetical protein